MSKQKVAWVSGTGGEYTLHVDATDWAHVGFWPVCNAKFKKYRPAQVIANAINAHFDALKRAAKGSK